MARRQAQKQNARQAKIAAIRAEEARRRRRVLLSVGAIVAVVCVVVVFAVTKAVTGSSSSSGGGSTAASGQVAKAATSVPPAVFEKVGTGAAQSPPTPIPGNHSLTRDGKPAVLYVGAEYCPYCAAERWAVVAALSRFGTFKNLGTTESASQDVYPSTATLSFHGADYSSPYLSFRGYETETNQRQGNGYAPLDTLPAEDQKVFTTFDAPPYVPAQSAGSIPFVDLGGKYMIAGASYDPGILQGKTHLEIAKAMSQPGSDIAQNVDGTANLITAALCKVTGDQPAKVCTASGVTAAAKMLKSS